MTGAQHHKYQSVKQNQPHPKVVEDKHSKNQSATPPLPVSPSAAPPKAAPSGPPMSKPSAPLRGSSTNVSNILEQKNKQKDIPLKKHLPNSSEQARQSHPKSSNRPPHHQPQKKNIFPKPQAPNIAFYRKKVKGLGGSGLSFGELGQLHTALHNEVLDTNTRIEILYLLGEERNTTTLPFIYKLLTNKNMKLREEALHLLYFAFQDRKAIPLILERLHDPQEHTEVRRKMLSVLKLFRAPETISSILDFLLHTNLKAPTNPQAEAANRQEIEDALDALSIILTLTENAHSFSLARGRGRKELFSRLLEVCKTQYNVDISHMESVLIVH